MSITSYAVADKYVIRIGNDAIELSIKTEGSNGISGLINKITNRTFNIEASEECVLRLGSGQWRLDIPHWKFHPGSGEPLPYETERGYKEEFFDPGLDDNNWMSVQLLTDFPIGQPGYSAVVYPGYVWYRHSFELPADIEGMPIEFGLGGCDNQDWLEYRVFLNGKMIGSYSRKGDWHSSPRYTLDPNDPAYKALQFGGKNVIAVQARGLDRQVPGMRVSDSERYSVGTFLVDQYVAVGPAQSEVTDFILLEHNESADADGAAVTLRYAGKSVNVELDVTYRIKNDDPAIYKQITVRNAGDSELTLLELDLQRMTIDAPVSVGGFGLPCNIADEAFCGIRHPAGIARGEGNSVSLTMYPGRKLSSGEEYQSKVAVFGVGSESSAGRAFVQHLEKHGYRKRDLLRMYHNYGIHDVAGMDEPTYMTEQLLLDNLNDIAAFKKRGIDFDYYYVDAGWSNPHGNLKDFDPRFFPNGPDKVFERMRELGMKYGLWTSPCAGPPAFHPGVSIPELEGCGNFPTGGSLCMTAEPWKSMYRDALLYHVRENGVQGFKLDGVIFMCTNPNHGHMTGKYSLEASMDAVIDILESVRAECPDVMFMFYWFVRSPWWLLWGDTIYERGVLMEGATPSDTPAKLLRQSITISFDQATHHAWDSVPLCSGDSLGVWLSKWRWGSYMGSEGWQDAWVMDIARGSMMCQLWGDLSMLNEQDIEFFSRISSWLNDNWQLLRHPKRILGDPWKAETYGYAYFKDNNGAVFLYNPQFEPHTVTIELDPQPGFTERDYALLTMYPFDCSADKPEVYPVQSDYKASIHLKPFEVKLLQLVPVNRELGDVLLASGKARRVITCDFKQSEYRELDHSDQENRFILRRVINGRSQYIDSEAALDAHMSNSDERDHNVVHRVFECEVEIPALGKDTSLVISAQLAREGIYWHHHALYDIVRLQASADGHDLPVNKTPHRWHEQAGGWSWIVFDIIPGESKSPRKLSLKVDAYMPDTVDIDFRTWLYEER